MRAEAGGCSGVGGGMFSLLGVWGKGGDGKRKVFDVAVCISWYG